MNKYVLNIFGEKYFGPLICLINSIKQVAPGANIQIFYQDISEEKINLLKKTWPQLELGTTSFNFIGDLTQRISSKTLMWAESVKRNLGNNICLLDIDTLVVKDVFHFFAEENFDLIFTQKDGTPSINGGVMMARVSPEIIKLFKDWEIETFKIFADPKLLEESLDAKKNFFGCDQMSFCRLIGYEAGQTEYAVNGLKIISKPCSVLNEMRPKPITAERHILHYKSRWLRLITEGLNFSKMRPKKTSWEMYIFYLKNCLESLKAVNAANQTNLKAKDIGIIIPFYLNSQLQENKILYPIYFLIAFIRHASKSLKKSLLK